MKNKYADLIEQTFNFPTEEFEINTDGELMYREIPMMNLIEKYGTPLRFSYLPKISDNIQRAKGWFKDAFHKHNYKGDYKYCYCTKSSHYKYVIKECLKNDVHIETSSAFDLDIIKNLYQNNEININQYIICNGFKTASYIEKIIELINLGFENLHVIIDNTKEFELLKSTTTKKNQSWYSNSI